MAQPLVVVDVQNGFINEFTHHIPERIRQLIESGAYKPVLFTRFINVPGSPYRRFLGWHGCADGPDTQIVPELERYAARRKVFDKHGQTGAPPELTTYLEQRRITCACIVGIDTDMCVLKVAMDLFDRGIRPVVLSDCCASTLGLQAHLAGLAVLSRNIGAEQIRDLGLGEGKLAAPPKDDAGVAPH